MENNEKFEKRWLRILACTGAKNDSSLARALGILPQSVTAARKRAQVPTGWIETISEKYNVTTDWLFFGRGPMRPEEPPTIAEKTSEDAPQAACPRCAKLETRLEQLEKELESERLERREWTAERRDLSNENRRLWKENADLRERCARLEEREKQGATPPLFDKRQAVRSSDRPEIG